MPTNVSPGVNVSEIDLTTVVPSVSTTDGGLSGRFQWGPLNTISLVENEDQLVKYFGKPDNNTYVYFYTAANFLSYGNKLRLVRIADEANAKNATYDAAGLLIKNNDHYDAQYSAGQASVGLWAAKHAGSIGNGLRVSSCPSATAYSQAATMTTLGARLVSVSGVTTVAGLSAILEVGSVLTSSAGLTRQISALATGNTESITATGTAITAGTTLLSTMQVGDVIEHGGELRWVVAVLTNSTATLNAAFTTNFTTTIKPYIRASLASAFTADLTANVGTIKWEYADSVGIAPSTSTYASNRSTSNDEMHIVIVDSLGKFTGVAGTVLEKYAFVSKAADAKLSDGTSNYYVDVVNRNSQYVRWMDHLPAGSNWGSQCSSGLTFTAVNKPDSKSLLGGADGNVPSSADFIRGYDFFKDAENVDIALIMGADSPTATATYIISSICEVRKDCIALLSPEFADVVSNQGNESKDIIQFRNTLPSSSYAFMDSGWKQQYDKYNDVNRWVPLNGDTAGLCVRTDSIADAWFSPAGLNRGGIKNVLKLAYNPGKAARDDLYLNGVNPVVSFPGQGTVLHGDKTLLSKPSAFDRINVRRLFIVLEKSISKAAKYSLFELNDAFTRASFKNLVEPYLRDVKGRRGVYDFRVVCDESNNTQEVIDRNEFRADIYIKPARSINFIQLNFVATRTGADFAEIVGTI